MSSEGKKQQQGKVKVKKEEGYDPSRLMSLMTDYPLTNEGRLGSFRSTEQSRFKPNISSKGSSQFTPQITAASEKKKQQEQQQQKKKIEDKMKKFKPNIPKEKRKEFGKGKQGDSGGRNNRNQSIMGGQHLISHIPRQMQIDEDDEESEKVKMSKLKEDIKKIKPKMFDGVKEPPITLPFNQIKEDEEMNEEVDDEELKGDSNSLASTSGSKATAVDAKDRDDSSKPLNQDLFSFDLSEDQLFFIQLPSSLPISSDKLRTGLKNPGEKKTSGGSGSGFGGRFEDEENIWTSDFENTLTRVPGGYIGEMVVYKSGKTKLKLGDVKLDMMQGTDIGFLQHVVAISMEHKNAFILGDVSKRIACTPDVGYLLQNSNGKNNKLQ